MLTNNLKKGMRVKLRNGWFADIADNMKGNSRLMKVYGTFTELGSVYAWDIAYYIPESSLNNPSPEWVPIEYTEKQLELMGKCKAMGF